MKRILFFLAAILVAPGAFAQSTSEESAVHDAVLDYVEALYDVEPERIERSVSKELVKFGYWRSSPTAEYQGAAMNFEQLKNLAAGWNVDNRQNITQETPKEIVVLDVLDKVASAKLTALWGVDYFLLEKMDDKWMIRHVLWQSPPQVG